MTYDVEEYLSPATVLICSKYQGIGHFRRQCMHMYETCKVCGTECADLRQHNCTNVNKCIHCNGNHLSNSIKCPIVKDYRAALTKKLLSSTATSTNNNNNNYVYNPALDPPLLLPQGMSIPNAYSSVTNKIEELIDGLAKMNETLERMDYKNKEVGNFMNVRKKNDD
ncbi:unnamed protein product [Didymodactylos carnosus]|uniref:Uncharacterized protein n=1 Tax=Didymodactylos carnosus TaxID=1234261 RepID=A0A814WQX2_9BILA|nr:unnamed protein product [Didymodactylos carnosus]CAF1464997.1 unnamed protein product [Didymodactylos carnosus]CAF3969840.1 unnamed protein product [Didymodactylos carnosus]CAF4257715.1 unnamed protein product [Didymodactylos carnosus]